MDLSSQMTELWYNNPDMDIQEWKEKIIEDMNEAEEKIRIQHEKEGKRLNLK